MLSNHTATSIDEISLSSTHQTSLSIQDATRHGYSGKFPFPVLSPFPPGVRRSSLPQSRFRRTSTALQGSWARLIVAWFLHDNETQGYRLITLVLQHKLPSSRYTAESNISNPVSWSSCTQPFHRLHTFNTQLWPHTGSRNTCLPRGRREKVSNIIICRL